MSNAAEIQRTEQELDARDALMRGEFQRQTHVWDMAIPVDSVLRNLKVRITRATK